MKVAQHTKYNKNNIVLNITEVPRPTMNENQVLIKVSAAGVNPLDNMISRGEVEIIVPYKLPQIAGNEVVGIVESVGNQVNNLQVGDRVFGRLPLDHIGAFAEYVAVDSQALAKVPAYLSCCCTSYCPNHRASLRSHGCSSWKDHLYLRWHWRCWWNGHANCQG